MNPKYFGASARILGGLMLGSACLALAVPGEARAACVNPTVGNNCQNFNSPGSNSFSYDVWSGAMQTASGAFNPAFQIVFDGSPANQVFNYTGVQLLLSDGQLTQTVTIADNSFTANGTVDVSAFTSPTAFSFGGVTSAVLSGVFSTTSPTLVPSTIFEAGVRFNNTGANTAGFLDFGGNNGPSGQNSQSSIYASQEVPGPLPVLGAGMAFGLSRKLRKRISAV